MVLSLASNLASRTNSLMMSILRPVGGIKHRKAKRIDASKSWIFRRLPHLHVQKNGNRSRKNGKRREASDLSSRFEDCIPAQLCSKDAALAKGIWSSANEERQALLNSKSPLSSKASFLKLSPLLPEPSSDMVNIRPFNDLTMKLSTLSSRSPTPTISFHSPTISLQHVSSSTSKPNALRKRCRSRENQDNILPPKQGLQCWPISLSPSQKRSHNHARRSNSPSLTKRVASIPRRVGVSEAKFKTSIFTNNEGISPGILSSSCHSDSITRTIVSVQVSPERSTSRRASRSRSRSYSRSCTPIPNSPKYTDGYRALASDRDIRELLEQRINQTLIEREQKGTPDLKGWKPAWSNSSLDQQFEESRRKTSTPSESQRPETTFLDTSIIEISKPPNDPTTCSTEPSQCIFNTTSIVDQEHSKVRERLEEPQIGETEQIDQPTIAQTCPDLSHESPLPPIEVSTGKFTDGAVPKARERQKSINFFPAKLQVSVSPFTAIAAHIE